MKILNLYAGIGCNRALWNDHEITAVELDTEIAEVYRERFPDDLMVMSDAHEFLRENFRDYDVIWSSPPCQSHSQIWHSQKTVRDIPYPDMNLYEEILFLKTWYDGKWAVENVYPYYDALVPPTVELDRHLFWSSSKLRPKAFKRTVKVRSSNKEAFARYHNIPDDIMEMMVEKFGGDARTLLRNGVHEKIGKYILDELIVRKNIRNKF